MELFWEEEEMVTRVASEPMTIRATEDATDEFSQYAYRDGVQRFTLRPRLNKG